MQERRLTTLDPGLEPRPLSQIAFVCIFLGSCFHLFCQYVQLIFRRLKAGPPPLEAILVIFGRRALIFFVWKLLENYEKWHHFCAHAQWWSPLETPKCRKKVPRSVEFNSFTICDRQKRFSQNERRRAYLQNCASNFLIFVPGLSYGHSKFSDEFTPFFRLWKTITKSLRKN